MELENQYSLSTDSDRFSLTSSSKIDHRISTQINVRDGKRTPREHKVDHSYVGSMVFEEENEVLWTKGCFKESLEEMKM